MADTVGNQTTFLKERFPDLTTAMAESYINQAHRELLGWLPELARHAVDIDTVNGTANYALPNDTLEVVHALYTPTSPNIALQRTTLDELAEKNPQWGSTAAGTPLQFYLNTEMDTGRISDLRITLYPKPSATATGGLRVYITEAKTLQTGDTLPDGLATYRVYLEGASYFAAEALRGIGAGDMYLAKFNALGEFCMKRWRKMMPATPFDSTYPLVRTK